MRNKIAAAKQTVKDNKVGIVVVGTVTIVYGSIAYAAYCNLQTVRTQLEIACVENLLHTEI